MGLPKAPEGKVWKKVLSTAEVVCESPAGTEGLMSEGNSNEAGQVRGNETISSRSIAVYMAV